jgi:IclR family transcriptional regulator, pca regulon regulatory protein
MPRTVGREDSGPDFIEALARGLDVIRTLGEARAPLGFSEVAGAVDLPRPTARRVLLTLEALGYVRSHGGGYELTPKVLELGTAHVLQRGIWDLARPHLEDLVAQTRESSSLAQLDGADIVYVARVAVPKIVTLRVQIGTRFPALQTSLGKVLLADLTPGEVETVLAEPSRSGVEPRWRPDRAEREAALTTVRAQGWALTDEQLAPGIRSVAAPVRDEGGRVVAAVNVTVHAAETSVETLLDQHLPRLLRTAGAISADVARLRSAPQREVG